MEDNNIAEALQLIEERIAHENTKRYWLVRTDDGRNYNAFAEGGYVALSLRNYPSAFIHDIVHDYVADNLRTEQIRAHLLQLYREGRIPLQGNNGEVLSGASLTRLANQIYALTYGISQDDIVIIPDRGADRLRIGRILDDHLYFNEQINRSFSYYRRVEWIKEIKKNRLDPCLYKALGAHQAVCDITDYAEYIERNINSYFVVKDQYHYVLTVNSEQIGAYGLSYTIFKLLDEVKNISETYQLGINIEDVHFSINVNSPGKFSFVTTARNAALIMAVATALFGGRIHYQNFEISTDGAFRCIVDCVNEYLDQDQARAARARAVDQYLESLDLRSVEEINNMVDEAEEEIHVLE